MRHIMVRQMHTVEKNGTDVSINFLRCLVDLGHHPFRVSDRHGSLCILLYRSDILYIVASVMLYRRDIPCLLPFLMLLQR